MPTKKPRLTFAISEEQLEKLESYQREHRIKNQSQAILRLLDLGMGEHMELELSRDARRIAEDYDALDSVSRKAVRTLIAVERERAQEQERKVISLPKAKRRGDGFVEVRVYDQPAAAGLGNYLDEPASHMEQYPEDVIPAKADFGIRISGNSMEPRFHDGSTVFVQAALTLESGQAGIFILNGKSYCKRLSIDRESRQVRLVSENPEYADILIGPGDELRTVGRILGQFPE